MVWTQVRHMQAALTACIQIRDHPGCEARCRDQRPRGLAGGSMQPSWAPSAQLLPARLPLPAVFCCLPHATTQEVVKELPQHVKVVDLSADFRLRDVATYAEW